MSLTNAHEYSLQGTFRKGSSFRTTQELVGHYLLAAPRDCCVVNAGLHDMSLSGGHTPKGMQGLTDDQYVENVRNFLQLLLASGCGQVVWLQTSSVQGANGWGLSFAKKPYGFVQNNPRILLWNKLVAEMVLSSFSPDKVFVLSPFEASRSSHFKHLGECLPTRSCCSTGEGSTTAFIVVTANVHGPSVVHL